MRTCITLTCLLISLGIFAQEYRFIPKWKVGEKRSALVTTRETASTNGEAGEESLWETIVDMEIQRETQEFYFLRINCDNNVLQPAPPAGEDGSSPGFSKVALLYSINKITGEVVLENWKEVRSNIFKDIRKSRKKQEKSASEDGSIDPSTIVAAYQTREGVAASFEKDLAYFLFPYGKTFRKMDTLVVRETGISPFNPSDTITMTSYSYVSNVNPRSGVCNVNTRFEMNISPLLRAMKDEMRRNAESFGSSDEAMQQLKKEMERATMAVKNSRVITFDRTASWPTEVVQTIDMVMHNGKERTNTRRVIRVLFK
jgi:hypothetical protein